MSFFDFHFDLNNVQAQMRKLHDQSIEVFNIIHDKTTADGKIKGRVSRKSLFCYFIHEKEAGKPPFSQ